MERKRAKASNDDGPVYNPIELLHHKLRINKDALDEELVDHPNYVMEAVRGHNFAISDKDAQEDYLDSIKGRIFDQVQEELKKKNPKVSVERIKLGVDANSEWMSERKKFRKLKKLVGEWEGLRKAFESRGYNLHSLMDGRISRERAEQGQFGYDSNAVRPRER